MDAPDRPSGRSAVPAAYGSHRADRLDPLVLAALGRLELVARGVVEGFLIGLHSSPHRGFSVEFAENRPYYTGDDVRFIDWRMFARSDRYFIKQYEEETNLRAYMLVDVSRSMAWTSDSSRTVSKLEYARLLTAALSLLLLRQADAVGLVAFDDGIREHVEPRAARQHLSRLLRALVALEEGGATDAGAAIREVAVRLRRRGLVVLVSDLLVEPEETRKALHYLRHRGHEILVFHLMDPAERDLPASGDALFFDPESREELLTNSAALRTEYRRSVDEAVESWRLECRRMGADYHLFTTDTPLGHVLGRYLEKRARLG
jgi:uncharacterized protein (DUF58 family)